MVQWEKQIEERSVPEWRDKYVAYARLKRKLEQIKAAASICRNGSEEFIPHAITRAAMESDYDESRRCSKESDTEAPLLHREETVRQKQEEFLHAVKEELVRVGHWYKDQVTALEAEVRRLSGEDGPGVGDAALTNLANQGPADIEKLHLKAVRLTEFVLLNVEALRKIVKKMDKQCGTSWQKVFVERDLKDSPLATNSAQPFNGERARACRRALEELVSPERLQEMRSRAMESGGVGLSTMPWSWRRTLVAVALAGAALKWSAFRLPDEPKCQRCLGLMIFTMLMWVLEAAPFEATAMLVAPLAVWLDVMEGDRHEQAKLLLAAVFNDSLYLVLSGFVMSSIFSKCQLELRAAALLQSLLGRRPKCFMLAIMILGVFLSALLSNVTAPLLMVEVLKPLIRDLPTDSRYSRALLLGLAFSCNVGGMMTPISSPQNVASLEALRQHGKNITWGEWLCLSTPFCFLAVVMAWLILLLVYQFDVSADEVARSARKGDASSRGIPPVVFDREDMSYEKLILFVGAIVTLVAFASAQAAATFGGTSSIALLFVAICMGTGGISRQTFNSYSWHLLFLIGGGSALGLAVRQSGLLKLVTELVRSGLSSSPWQLVAELMLVLVGATTFVSHTVAALVLMPLVVELGEDAGVERLAVLLGAFACSAACALPMTSFPNVNSLIAVDDRGKPWLSVKHFLMAGIPTTVALTLLLITAGYKLGVWVLS